ncbi:MAG: HlyD family secretion protein [Erysipelotrichaceae bacterium]|jgi:multidrug resistance efflux pump|nr:HlyD family secretion protein [Erysipelotrichaceae bacterium]
MKLYNSEDLKDSRIFFDKNPPPFAIFFIFFTAVILVLALIVSSFLIKPYVVSAAGVVTTTDTQYVSANQNGMIVDILVQEGENVTAGQAILKVSNGQENLQVGVLQDQLEQANERMEILDRYEKSLNEKKNHMKNSGLEQEYYGSVEYYLAQVSNDEYTKKTLQSNLTDKETQQNKLKNEITDLTTKMNNETDQYLKADYQTQIATKQAQVDSLESEIKSLKDQINSPNSSSSQYYLQLIAELGKTRSTLQATIDQLESDLSVTSSTIDTYTITAQNAGILHYLSPLSVGMSLTATQVVAEISTQDSNNFIVEAYVNATDISKIQVGDKVHVAISGVNSVKYGTLDGVLMSIDSGTIGNEALGTLQYRVKIKLNKISLTSKDDTINLIMSMPVEVRIVYEEETYLEWLLEILNFKN